VMPCLMPYSTNIRENYSHSASEILFRATTFTLLFISLAIRSSAQSADAPAIPPSSEQSAPASDATPQKVSAATPKPNPLAKPKKVITNDDLEPRSGNGPSRKPGDGDSGSFLACEGACEQQAREELGFDADREADWQMQVVSARRELSADTEWRQMLLQAIQQTNTYCNFLAQQSQKVSPSNNSYNARTQRAQSEQYFQNMNRTLQQNLQSLANRMSAHTNEVGVLSPVRAAMMYVQGNRILHRECQFPPAP
jgi:hypothetical protein